MTLSILFRNCCVTLLLLLNQNCYAFSPRLTQTTSFVTSTRLSVNGDDSSTSNSLAITEEKTQLFSAFAALSLPDQYDAVLTGLCAKLLDDNKSNNLDKQALQDPMQLVQEMNEKNIPASPRSLMALVDSTVKTQDAPTMAAVLSLCRRNRQGIAQYGAQQADLLLLPATPTTTVKCPDGTVKTRRERLQSVDAVPSDNRVEETTAALSFGTFLAVCTTTNVLGMSDITPLTNVLLWGAISVGVVDNFYDILTQATQWAAKEMDKDDWKLPAKDTLPLGLGSGKWTGNVVRGLTRLLTVDAERESRCEAAALYAAYVLGLPCFAFRPNAYESSVLVVESIQEDSPVDSLLTSSGILRMLVWLMAPVAMESAFYPQLIMSDPREAAGFLDRLEELPELANSPDLWWRNNPKEREDLLQWAYAEADLLLRTNRPQVTEMAQRLTGGAATVGDCVAVMENW
ncbi:hypothetical protein FisN_2Hh404 [Fistulifera solaris]|uniref:Uncharacterized protein n=1 Tax=Fistulifera solaris TaxID=1519565 RepID=A0A1Z5KK19_FISSO|nr:hypothetical protein FisN_2Hh404 [Fistulifera solaris]|eukprot:GAX26660.1 hypothetical protein FisN_2Hh404 [Fistulifera solaris]